MSQTCSELVKLDEPAGACYGEGFAAAAIAVLCFGSNFVPVKKFNTGDGMFFQWIQCAAIWLVGMAVQLGRGQLHFYPLAMLGGFFWATGNVMVVPIVKMIGLGLGLLIWGTSNLIMGWASGRFGLFQLKPQGVAHSGLNYAGVAFALVSVVIFAFVRPENNSSTRKTPPRDYLPVNGEDYDQLETFHNNNSAEAVQDRIWVDNLSETQKRVLGVLGSVVSGIFYGVNFDPPQYLIDHHSGSNSAEYSPDSIDYAFSHFCGIFLTSTGYFILYCAFMKSRPKVFPEAILPGFVCGGMWATAQCGWFVANSRLSLVVSFPIISTGPGLVGALWGIFLFKEIRGRKNLAMVVLAFLVEFAAIALITVSGIQ